MIPGLEFTLIVTSIESVVALVNVGAPGMFARVYLFCVAVNSLSLINKSLALTL